MLSASQALLTLLLFLVSAYFFSAIQLRKRIGSATTLPGPKGNLLVGNLLDVPQKHSWLKFKEWGDQFGPVYGLNIAGTTHVILSTERAANDLLVKRGSIYSGRGGLISLSEGTTAGFSTLMSPPNDIWRKHRRLGNSLMNSSVMSSYVPAHSLESATTLLDLLESPQDYERHLERYTSGILFRVGMGKRVLTGNEEDVRLAYYIIHYVEKIGSPGANLCDVFPILWMLPSLLYPFKRELARHHELEDGFYKRMQDEITEQTKQGRVVDCWQKRYLETRADFGLNDKQGRWAIGNLLAAGMPTTSAALLSFLLAMVHHPEWQAKMQGEVDRVVGSDRLPEPRDLPELPTLRAVVKETLRWRPVTAGGIPHMLEQDDVYMGYFLPKGSLIHANQWAIHNDPERYPDPEHFRPDRWLDPAFPTYQVPLSVYPNLQGFSAFGFGRRICPGLIMAERSMNVLAARVAWACQISKKIDPQTGESIFVPQYHYTTGFNTQPMPFQFDLKPRDAKRLELLRKVVEAGKLNDPLVSKEDLVR